MDRLPFSVHVTDELIDEHWFSQQGRNRDELLTTLLTTFESKLGQSCFSFHNSNDELTADTPIVAHFELDDEMGLVATLCTAAQLTQRLADA